MTTQPHPAPVLERRSDHWRVSFQAMGGPCELLLECEHREEAESVAHLASTEVWRIEHKFSRYVPGNIIHQINQCAQVVELDAETAGLIDFAFVLHKLSGGLFDITSGVLRKVWTFDGSSHVPDKAAIDALLPYIGLQRIDWQTPNLKLPVGMQLDLGGIGKEYAVDRVTDMLREHYPASCLINFGGDLAVSHPRTDGATWRVGVAGSERRIALNAGALATSGDANRFILSNGHRYSHIVNPRTGWPMEDAPHSVTVLGESCTQAGMLSTLAMLKGSGAEAFLDAEGVTYWCQRSARI